MHNPKVSIVIPFYDKMDNKWFFFQRCLKSIHTQTFESYEVIISEGGSSPENTNKGILQAKGDIIHILHMDDYFSWKYSLEDIVKEFDDPSVFWVASSCVHDNGRTVNSYHQAIWNDNIKISNTLGAPSVISFRNQKEILMNEHLVWVFDCEWYNRMAEQYGVPKCLKKANITIGLGPHQATNTITDEVKLTEMQAMIQ